LIFLLVILTLVFLVIGGGAWYLTTDAGFRAFILPRVARAAGLELTATRAEWHPFSSLTLHDLRVGPSSEPLLVAKQVTVHYDGRAVLQRKWIVGSLQLESPTLHVIRTAQAPPKTTTEASEPAASSPETPAPPAAALASLRIAKLSVRDLKLLYTATDYSVAISGLRLDASNIAPEGKVNLDLEGDWAFKPTPPAPASAPPPEPSPLAFHTRLVAEVGMDATFHPRTISGDITSRGLNGTIAGEPLRDLIARSHVDLSTAQGGVTMLKQAQVSILKNNTVLATMSATGPLDLAEGTMDLDLQTGPIQSNVLEILFFSKDLDFEKSSLSYVGHVSIGDHGRLLKSDGRLDADIQSVTSPSLPPGLWKPVTARIEHNVECDRARRHVVVNKLDLDIKQQNRPLVQALLDRPLFLSWSETTGEVPRFADTDFNLKVIGLDCATWLPLLGVKTGSHPLSGAVDATARVNATNQGHNLDLDLHATLSRGAGTLANFKLTDATLQFDGQVAMKNLQSAQTRGASLKIAEKGKPLLNATVDGVLDVADLTGAGVLQVESPLPNLAALRTVPDLVLGSGELKGAIEWKLLAGNHLEAKTDLQVNNLNFAFQRIVYQQAALIVKGTGLLEPDAWSVEKGQVSFFIASQPAGSWQGSLAYRPSTSALQGSFSLLNWKPSALGPLLARWLPGRKLKSIDLSSQVEIRTEGGATNVKANAVAKKFAMESTAARPLEPLNASLSVDASFATNGTATIRSASLQLDPTATAKNLLQVNGTVRQAANTSYADLNVRGDTIDISPYYDQIFPPDAPPSSASPAAPAPTANVASGSAAASATASPAPAPAASRDIKLTVAIDSFKARDLVVTNFKAPFRMRGDSVELPDIQFKLNGATVIAKICPENGPPPAPYYIEIKADSVPLQPLASAFMPELKEEIGGTATTSLTGRSRGTTMAEFAQSFTGDFTLAVRNAHLEQLPGIQKTLVELSILTLCPDIKESTVDNIDASARIASQKIHTDNLHATGSAVEATLRGDFYFDKRIDLETLLKLNRKVISRSSPFASLLNVVSAEKGDWIRLPGAVPIDGTTSDPKPHVDPRKMLGESLLNTGGKILKEFLQPKSADTNAPPASSNPSQPPEQKPNVIDKLFKGLFGK
jgi:hypothetical protein